MSRTLSPSWSSEGLTHTLMIGPIVAEVVPNADKSAWIWEIRVSRARRSTAVIARSYTGVADILAAKLEAEDALRNLAASIGRILNG